MEFGLGETVAWHEGRGHVFDGYVKLFLNAQYSLAFCDGDGVRDNGQLFSRYYTIISMEGQIPSQQRRFLGISIHAVLLPKDTA